MIYFLTTGAHKYALRELADVPEMPELRILSYRRIFKQKALKPGTYIFCDLDRLDFWSLELAANLYRVIVSEGWLALNDPAQVRQRFTLLKTLQAAGLNSFSVSDPAYEALPSKFPVFLRTRAAHRGVFGELCHSAADCDARLKAALEAGHCLSDLMFVEFCAEPIEGTLYRKSSAFRIGEDIITGMAVHEHNWHAKYGEEGAATQALYEDEFEAVKTNRHGTEMHARFTAAHVEFGRADFAIVQGRVETYEINTNPYVSRILDHPTRIRIEADRLYHEKLAAALAKLDTSSPKARPLLLDQEIFETQRWHDRLMLTDRWRP